MDTGKLIDSMKRVVKSELGSYDTTATVRRIEGDTAWVHIPGGVDETPVRLTMNAKEGDNVQVRVSDGKAFLAGNVSAPPTDDTRANQAYTVADIAAGAAENALSNATRAREAADRAEGEAVRAGQAADTAEGHAQTALTNAGLAQTAAANAQNSADSALVSLSTVEDVVGVLNWITAHGTMTLTSDVTVNPAHVYFVVDPAGDYVVGGTHYSIVSEPKDAELSTYYELSVDESVQNYVATHVVVDTEGLWLIPENNVSVANSSKKILISVGGVGHSYPTAGTYIIEKVNGTDQVVAMFTATGVSYGDSTTASGTNSFALGQHTTASGQSSQAAGYYSTATAILSHAEGYATHATSDGATAIGYETTASGDYSFSEGSGTTASGAYSHAQGAATTASGNCSHAQGTGTTADQANQVAIGKYNTTNNTNNLFVIGNGAQDGGGIFRRDAFQVDIYGNVDIASGAKYKINGTNLAASDVGALPISGGTVTGSLAIDNHSSAIGTVKQAYAAAKSVASGTNTNLTSISLEAGTWVITGGVRFPNNATGYRRMNISTSNASGWADVQLPALSGASTQLAYTVVVSTSSTKTYYLNCYHNAGAALSLMAGGSENGINFLRAVRIA